MPITPAPGYIVDPSNPNAVIKDPGTSTSLGGMGGGSTSYGAVNQPVATAPVTPAPQIQSPSAPQTKNFTTPSGAQVQAPAAQNVPASGTQMGGQPQAGLTMPATGSVVDLLNMAGQDSSFQARQQLAQQFGIQGYTGTASQNQELSKKYLEAYNAKKSTAPPTSGAQAASELDQYFSNEQQQPTTDPVKGFMDVFSSMNPIEAQIFNDLSTALSAQTNMQSLTDLWKQEMTAQGIPEINLELADLDRIMEGTEDDIRAEITNAGGFATESQVQALTAARNKTLLKKANYLSNVFAAKNEYVDRVVSLTQADRKQVSEDLDRKLGISKMLVDMTNQMQDRARDNYKMVIDAVGWDGLVQSLQNNPQQMSQVEKLFGLGKGQLKALAAYKSPSETEDELRLENIALQNQKLRADLGSGPAVQTQVVDIGGKKVLINSKTGEKIADLSGLANGEADGLRLLQSQNKVAGTKALLNHPGLNSAVGPTYAGRTPLADFFTGAKSEFIGAVQTLTRGLSLEELISAKAAGATFGALSEGELGLLESAATKLNSPGWTVRDDAGNVIGWKVTEDAFKKELDTINYYATLDFVLKGGDPTAVGAFTTPDGKMWYQNYDGSLTEL